MQLDLPDEETFRQALLSAMCWRQHQAQTVNLLEDALVTGELQ